MNRQDLLLIEDTLDRNIQEFLDEGGQLVSRTFGNCENKCCAITATVRKVPNRLGGYEETLSDILGIKIRSEDMWQIVNGFDGLTSARQTELYQIGQNLRNKYLVKR
jgi:hypothetical protein